MPAPEAPLPLRPFITSIVKGCGRGAGQDGGVALCQQCTGEYVKLQEVMPNEDGVGDDQGQELHAEEDVQPSKTLNTPVLPSQAYVDFHSIDHIPYRAWCGSCVCGRGHEAPHHPVEPGSRTIAVISFDDFFLVKNWSFTRREWDLRSEAEREEEHLKVLVVKDAMGKYVFTHAVERKGVDDDGYVVECLVKDVQWLGYSKVVLKSDNEPAIVRVLQDSLKALRVEGLDRAAEEHPPPFDPQANGDVEAAVKTAKNLSRTYVHCLEHRLQRRILPTHPVLTWLAQHAAAMHSRRARGSDGLSAHQRVRGNAFNTRMLEFGEMCRYKLRGKELLENSSMSSRWKPGVFVCVCVCGLTGQYLLHCEDKVASAR